MTPAQLREMAERYRNRPCVEKEAQRLAEVSDRECREIAEALEHAASEIESLRRIKEQWREAAKQPPETKTLHQPKPVEREGG